MVGHRRPAEAPEAANVYGGGMRAGDGKPLGPPPEPPQSVFKHRRLKGDIKRAQTVLGYHTAPALSDDDFALRILGHVLGAGRSSRLFQSVKEKAGIVDFIGASVESCRDIRILPVPAAHDPGHRRD